MVVSRVFPAICLFAVFLHGGGWPAVASLCQVGVMKLYTNRCLNIFKHNMEWLHEDNWCDWSMSSSLYDQFTKCTMMGAHEASCFWPNPTIDEVFSTAHHLFFPNCSLDRLADPPPLILGLLIALPSVLTITTTAAVLCIVKRHEVKV
uniref:receptor activity-modifying protein 1-like n=1 Tax=Myxine glutinosa TaxID=7769 RepID=UPI00358EEEF1